MGRNRYKAFFLILPILLLTGCINKPGDINPNLPYVSGIADGNAIGDSQLNDPSYGQDAYNPNDPNSGNSAPEKGFIHKTEPSEEYWQSYFEQHRPDDYIEPERQTTDTSQSNQVEPDIVNIDFESAKTYSEEQLYTYYGNQDTEGYYYDNNGAFYNKNYNNLGIVIDVNYGDALARYTSDYGDPTLYFVADEGNTAYTYWIGKTRTYCIKKHGSYTIWSVGDTHTVSNIEKGITDTNWVTGIVSCIENAYADFGTPIHMDRYNYIFDSGSGYVIIDKSSNIVTVI